VPAQKDKTLSQGNDPAWCRLRRRFVSSESHPESEKLNRVFASAALRLFAVNAQMVAISIQDRPSTVIDPRYDLLCELRCFGVKRV
jgi:hypothetical protein